jgi:hypothetical protein
VGWGEAIPLSPKQYTAYLDLGLLLVRENKMVRYASNVKWRPKVQILLFEHMQRIRLLKLAFAEHEPLVLGIEMKSNKARSDWYETLKE